MARSTRKNHPPPAFQPESAGAPSLGALRKEAESCERCDLYRNATQLVFGDGDTRARVVLVGEQPGNEEDLKGRPFVGPAGRVLDECLKEAGVDRSQCYVTNAVKHFKFEQRGKRCLHARPNGGEVQRCAWWLGAELRIVEPDLVVAMGATAFYALTGRASGVTKERGHVLLTPGGTRLLVTIHPSYLLRLRDRQEADRQHRAFVSDLHKIGEILGATT
ncbi:UdgX family uracil-DNA binding protein [Agrobacterium sp. B1(2019)]|uniref:UdgX family uracil-DNA binding protein n=1 Tax=Agrobacterium sp. B1(2019) TaxID=2607032 RepID=UPI0011EE7DA1|nr:UdgX family uracil-DNA binding protein [Agrobacterium sp. B1(2019)]TZG34058.1 UdgX family uracil-DNA binding protein [Agrobacterium sp. B1(2019)]